MLHTTVTSWKWMARVTASSGYAAPPPASYGRWVPDRRASSVISGGPGSRCALGGNILVPPDEAGHPQSSQVVFQKQSGLAPQPARAPGPLTIIRHGLVQTTAYAITQVGRSWPRRHVTAYVVAGPSKLLGPGVGHVGRVGRNTRGWTLPSATTSNDVIAFSFPAPASPFSAFSQSGK